MVQPVKESIVPAPPPNFTFVGLYCTSPESGVRVTPSKRLRMEAGPKLVPVMVTCCWPHVSSAAMLTVPTPVTVVMVGAW